MKIMKCRIWILGTILCMGMLWLTGCHTRPPLEELGELEFAVPDLPGIDDPYPIPEAPGKTSSPTDSKQSQEKP